MTLVMAVNASQPMMLEIPLALAKLEKCWQRPGLEDKLRLMVCTEWMNPSWITAMPPVNQGCAKFKTNKSKYYRKLNWSGRMGNLLNCNLN